MTHWHTEKNRSHKKWANKKKGKLWGHKQGRMTKEQEREFFGHNFEFPYLFRYNATFRKYNCEIVYKFDKNFQLCDVYVGKSNKDISAEDLESANKFCKEEIGTYRGWPYGLMFENPNA